MGEENTKSLVYLGDIYFNGQDIEKNYLKAKYYYELAAQKNDSEAFYKLGLIYFGGHGVDIDYNEAAKYFILSAKKSNQAALFQLGYMYECGFGVPQDYSKCLYFYKAAANLNHTYALIKLGYFYSNGVFVDLDLSQAEKYLSKLIGFKNTKIYGFNINLYIAYNDLGLIYYTEFHDIQKSKILIMKSAFDEYPFGQNNYGLINQFYLENIMEAKYMFEKSSKNNFALADFNLGFLHEKEGKIEESIKYYIKASENDDKPLIFRNTEIKHDERLQISKMFIICLTNLKLTMHYLSKENDNSKGKEYFIKAISLFIRKNYKFAYKIIFYNQNIDIDDLFTYVKAFIFNFPDFGFEEFHEKYKIKSNVNEKEINSNSIINENKLYQSKSEKSTYDVFKKEKNISFKNEIQEKNEDMINNPSDLFDFVIENVQFKKLFVQQIQEIIDEMNKILYEPPYLILFGRIKRAKSQVKKTEIKHQILSKDITQNFYEGFGEIA